MKIVFAVNDNAAQEYGMPIFLRHRNEALRAFRDEVNNPESPIGKHPTDYELWQLAEYDEETGQFFEQRERIIRGADLVQPKEPNALLPQDIGLN